MVQALYVHVPFCDEICSYCDFTRVKTHPLLIERYLFSLAQELNELPNHAMRTVYIGGGTPSALTDDELETLFVLLAPFTQHVEEYTIEVNPESLTEAKTVLMKQYGINRVSMGVQTFNQEELKQLNRRHSVDDIKNSIDLLNRFGITNVSIDLIYGLPSQTLESFVASLNEAVRLPITHLSLYSLTIEENSTFGRMDLQPIDPETEEDMYFKAVEILVQHGFHHYEISAFSKGHPSKHNLVYWHYEEFYGVGPGASAMVDHRRRINTTNLQNYAEGKRSGEVEMLSNEDEMFEFFMMGLRLTEGIELSRFKDRFQLELMDIYGTQITEAIQKKQLELSSNRLTTTEKGAALLNDVLITFLPKDTL